MKKKFKFYCKELGMTEAFSIEELKSSIIKNCYAYSICLQYLGYCVQGRELYEGDIIELTITDELMNIHQNGFANSNIGKHIAESIKEGNPITSILCAINPENKGLSTGYSIYCLRNGKIQREEDGELEIEAISFNDAYFPQYLIEKGAVYIGNIVETPSLLQDRGEIWKIPVDKFYVSINSMDDIPSSIPTLKDAYRKGYTKCFVDIEDYPFTKYVLTYESAINRDYPIFEFENFKYSDIWNRTKGI